MVKLYQRLGGQIVPVQFEGAGASLAAGAISVADGVLYVDLEKTAGLKFTVTDGVLEVEDNG